MRPAGNPPTDLSLAVPPGRTTLSGDVHFGPIDSIFMAAGVLTFVAGLYAMVAMRGADTEAAEDLAVSTGA